jgi:hypothetical protein
MAKREWENSLRSFFFYKGTNSIHEDSILLYVGCRHLVYKLSTLIYQWDLPVLLQNKKCRICASQLHGVCTLPTVSPGVCDHLEHLLDDFPVSTHNALQHTSSQQSTGTTCAYFCSCPLSDTFVCVLPKHSPNSYTKKTCRHSFLFFYSILIWNLIYPVRR